MSEQLDHDYAPYASKLEQRVVFFFVAVGIVSLTYGIFFLIDFLPEKPTPEMTETEEISTTASTTTVATLPILEETSTASSTFSKGDTRVTEGAGVPVDALPISIIFDTLDHKEVKILNPDSDSAQVLDEALLSGVVRHPGSADFENIGTIFLLGHSSYLPVVHNKNFQAFNGIQKLVFGDTIRLRSLDTEYVYSVDRVYQAKASSAEVPIQQTVAKLILATCNSFATKDDRYIVEATLVESHSINQVQ